MKNRPIKWITGLLALAMAFPPMAKPIHAEDKRSFLYLTSQELPDTTLTQHQIDYLTEQFYQAFETGEDKIHILYDWMDEATAENSLSYEEILRASDYASVFNLFRSLILIDDRGILMDPEHLRYEAENIVGISDVIVSLELFPMKTELPYTEELDVMQKELEKIQQKASSCQSPFLKTWFYHDYLVDLITYDTENAESFDEDGIIAHAAYGGLKKHSCVCAGYAQLYSYLLNRDSIQCYTVNSDTLNHAWNAIRFGEDWYFVDVTWDDSYKNRSCYMKNASTFEENGHGTEIWELPNGTDARPLVKAEEFRGDVNGDGEVSQNDIVYLYRYLTLVFDKAPKHIMNGDMDQDGVVDVFDLGLLKRKLYLRTTDMY